MRAIRFASVLVREAPGFENEYRPRLEELGEGFNLVLAPNAAGKSTLARAMRSLIWPKSEDVKSLDVEAVVDAGDGPLRVRVGGGVSYGDPFAPTCARAPYHDFRLSDLLQTAGATEQEMAASIEQVWKGYDPATMAKWFDGKADSLRLLGGPAVRLVPAAQGEHRNALERRDRVRAAAKEQNHLDERLAIEREELAALVPADALAREGAMLGGYLRARDRVVETLDVLRGFDPKTVLFAPGDLDRRRRLAEDLKGAERDVREQTSRVEDLRRERGGRPGRVLTREEREELKDRTAVVRTAAQALEKANDDLRGESARVAAAVASAGGLPLPAGFDALAVARHVGEGMVDLEAKADRWAKAEAGAAAFAEMEGMRPLPFVLEPEREKSPETPSTTVREQILARWEAAKPAESGSEAGLYLLLGAVALGVVAAFLPESIRLVGAALALVVAVVGFIQARKREVAPVVDAGELRTALEREEEGWRAYAATQGRIEANVESVKRQAEEAARAKTWWQGVERKYEPYLMASAEVPKERAALAAILGLPVGTSGLTLTLAYRLVATLTTAEGDLATRRAAQAAAQERFERAWSRAGETVERLGGHLGQDADDLAREADHLEDLSSREENLRAAERELRGEEARRDALLAESAALHEARGLELHDVETFERLAEASDKRIQTLAELRDRRRSHRQEFRSLEPAGVFARMRSEGFFDLDLLRRMVQTNAHEVDERRTEIETRQARVREYESNLREARKTDNLEMADAALGQAREDLARTREAVAEAAAGAELLAWLDETVRRTDLPEVLRAANDLLDRAVPGLELGAEGGKLVAYEGGKRKEMAHLSDGTRVQAILAARLGFLKHQEEGLVRAPLFLDETLANSDVQRAESVMRMVLELCREGRQIFYFSNQAGEAARWRDVAFDLDPELFRHHPLDVPGRARLRISDAPGDPEYLAGLPDPTLGFAAYLEALVLSPCDPWADHLGDLPLAWLCTPDEVENLHEAVRSRRDTLNRLLTRSGAYDPVWIARIKARAAYLDELRQIWCQGRSKPWRRGDLDRYDRKGVADKGRRVVAALLESEEVGGDPSVLHRTLRSMKKIDGWGAETREDFLDWLGRQLPEEQPLDREAARAQAALAARRHLQPEGPLAPEDLDRLADLLSWKSIASGGTLFE